MKQMMKKRWMGYIVLFLITLGCWLGKPMISRAIATPSLSVAAASPPSPVQPAHCQTATAQQQQDCLLIQAQEYLTVNNDNQAKDTLERLLSPEFSETLDKEDKVRVWQTLGNIYAKRGDLGRARTLLEQSRDQATTPAAQSAARYSLALIASTELDAHTIVGMQSGPVSPTVEQMLKSYDTFHTQLLQTLQQFDDSAAPFQSQGNGQSPAELAQVETLQAKLAQMRLLVTQLPKFYQFFSSDPYQNLLKENSEKLSEDELKPQIDELKKRIEILASWQRQLQPIQQYIEQLTRTLAQGLPPIQIAFQDASAQSKVLDKSGTRMAEKLGDASPDRRWLAAQIYHAQTLMLLPELANGSYEATIAYNNLATLLASSQADLKQKEAQLAAGSTGKPALATTSATPLASTPAVARFAPPKPVFLLPADLQAQMDALVRDSYPEAAQRLAAVIKQARRGPFPTLEFQATVSLVKLYDRVNQPEQITQLLTPAMLQNADRLGAPELAAPLYGYYAHALHSQGKSFLAQALVASDVAIARIQAVRGDLLALAPGVQYSYRNDVESFYRENIELRLLNNPTPEDLKIVRDRIEDLQLAEIQNYFREPCIKGKNTELDNTLDKDSPNTAIIYPIVSSEQLTVIVRLPHQPLQVHNASASADEVTAAVRAWKKELSGQAGDSSGASTKITGRKLYDWLIAPYAESLKAVDTLVFVLDGELRNVPMAALVDEQNRYLIESKAVVVSPGLQLFDPHPIANRNLQVFMAGLKGKPNAKYDELKFVQAELDAIAKTGIRHTELQDKFESTSLQREIQANPFNIVHLSTHGTFSEKLENTYLVSEGGADPDGKILITRLQEVLQSRDRTREEPIELLVLSACETAVSDRAALGIAGLTLKTGVRSTVATLWAVYDDPGIPQFFDAFYTALQQPNATRAKALQTAQLALLLGKDTTYASPVHWAPFILLGSWM